MGADKDKNIEIFELETRSHRIEKMECAVALLNNHILMAGQPGGRDGDDSWRDSGDLFRDNTPQEIRDSLSSALVAAARYLDARFSEDD